MDFRTLRTQFGVIIVTAMFIGMAFSQAVQEQKGVAGGQTPKGAKGEQGPAPGGKTDDGPGPKGGKRELGPGEKGLKNDDDPGAKGANGGDPAGPPSMGDKGELAGVEPKGAKGGEGAAGPKGAEGKHEPPPEGGSALGLQATDVPEDVHAMNKGHHHHHKKTEGGAKGEGAPRDVPPIPEYSVEGSKKEITKAKAQAKAEAKAEVKAGEGKTEKPPTPLPAPVAECQKAIKFDEKNRWGLMVDCYWCVTRYGLCLFDEHELTHGLINECHARHFPAELTLKKDEKNYMNWAAKDMKKLKAQCCKGHEKKKPRKYNCPF